MGPGHGTQCPAVSRSVPHYRKKPRALTFKCPAKLGESCLCLHCSLMHKTLHFQEYKLGLNRRGALCLFVCNFTRMCCPPGETSSPLTMLSGPRSSPVSSSPQATGLTPRPSELCSRSCVLRYGSFYYKFIPILLCVHLGRYINPSEMILSVADIICEFPSRF